MLVSWATCDAQLGNTKPVSTSGIRSAVYYGKSNNQLDSTAEGAATSYAYDYSSLGYGTSYASPVLHHVLLKGERHCFAGRRVALSVDAVQGKCWWAGGHARRSCLSSVMYVNFRVKLMK